MRMQDVANRIRDKVTVWTYLVNDRAGTERFLWAKGYARHCDFGGPSGYWRAGTDDVQPEELFRDAYAGAQGLVWVRQGTASTHGRVNDLDHFVRHALPSIRRPFVLLTGDGFVSVPSGLDPRTVEALLQCPWMVAWYAQNHDGTGGPKFANLPLGLDLHTPSAFSSPRLRVKTLSAIAASRVPVRQQPLRVFCDVGLYRNSLDRHIVVTRLEGCDHVEMQRQRVSRTEIWRRYADHPFVLSARGHGLDCHRTWEALYLGSIVIALKSSLDPLYEGLPVVSVDAWGDVLSRDNLRRWLDRYADLAVPERIARLLDTRTIIAKARARLAAG